MFYNDTSHKAPVSEPHRSLKYLKALLASNCREPDLNMRDGLRWPVLCTEWLDCPAMSVPTAVSSSVARASGEAEAMSFLEYNLSFVAAEVSDFCT